MPCFEKQGGYPVVESNTYLYYIQTPVRPAAAGGSPTTKPPSRSSARTSSGCGRPTSSTTSSIRVEDYVFANGVVGKMIVYDMEERQRVKIVDYEGLKKVDQSKIDEKLKEKSLTIKLDSFLDPGLISSVTGVVRELYAAEGLSVRRGPPEIKDVEGGTKLVHVTFHVTEGPKVKIRDVDFVGNQAISDGTLNGR